MEWHSLRKRKPVYFIVHKQQSLLGPLKLEVREKKIPPNKLLFILGVLFGSPPNKLVIYYFLLPGYLH